MLSPQEPDPFVKRLICNPVLENKLKYYLGSVMHDGDLYGAAADAADACFVIGDPASKVRVTLRLAVAPALASPAQRR